MQDQNHVQSQMEYQKQKLAKLNLKKIHTNLAKNTNLLISYYSSSGALALRFYGIFLSTHLFMGDKLCSKPAWYPLSEIILTRTRW